MASLASGQSVTLELSGTVPSGATGSTYTNTATASASDATAVTASDTDILTTQATLSITKTDNDGGSSVTGAVGTAVPGNAITYTVVASNAGPSTATGATVTDPLALNADIASDTWTATQPAGPPASAPPARAPSTTRSPSRPGDRSPTRVTALLTSSVTGTLSNTATASASDASTVSATDTDTLKAQAALTITKTDGVSSIVAGSPDT